MKKFSRWPVQFYFKTILFVFFLTFCYYNFVHLPLNAVPKKVNSKKVNLEYITVHIDLKGAPPRIEYLMSLLPDLKELGVNSLLVEYEDMFPYKDFIANISTSTSYSERELKKFLYTAASLNIEIIPLLQLFGNMEHVLKLREFEHLRENPIVCSNFCPLLNFTTLVISEMLKQVISFHEKVAPLKHIHIGCKEPNHIVTCKLCKAQYKKNNTIFMDHMKTLHSMIKTLAPNATILLWDDVLRKMNRYNDMHEVTPLVLGEVYKMEPVVWDPSPELSKCAKHTHLNKVIHLYRKAFGNNLWVASAFRGADTVNEREVMIPDLKNRLLNNLNWLHFIQNYRSPNENETFEFKGIILTGWSRKDHFSPINELLPVSLKTLTYSLRLIEKFRNGLPSESSVEKYFLSDWFTVNEKYFENIHEEMAVCESLAKFMNRIPAICRINNNLTYELHKTIRNYENVIEESTEILNKNPNHRIEFGYGDITEMSESYAKMSVHLENLDNLEILLKRYLLKYFDTPVIDEYLGFRSYTVRKRMNNYLKVVSKMLSKKVWGRGRSLKEWSFETNYKNIFKLIWEGK